LAGRIKKKDHENLSDSNIEKVIEALNAVPPISKKEACSRLNITYNTTRLGKIVDEFLQRKERDKKLRAANRGKPPQPHEIQRIIVGYLDGQPMGDLANELYRSPSFVKEIVDKVGVPQRVVQNYWEPPLLPDRCVKETFPAGEIVWSARYQAPAIVLRERTSSSTDYKVYEIYIIEEIEEESPYFPQLTGYGGRYANQPAHELGSLEHLKEYGVDIYKPYRNYFPKLLSGR
jgi:hypothetical protein